MTFFSEETKSNLVRKLEILYKNQATSVYQELELLLTNYNNNYVNQRIEDSKKREKIEKYTKNDIILNTYADSIQGDIKTPINALNRFSRKFLRNVINGCHILPFFSWDTDRGFSVLNYYTVDPRNGTWEDFENLKDVFSVLMVDCVLNHASLNNPLVQGGLLGNFGYDDFVIAFDEKNKPTGKNQLKITRARPYPVLTEYFVVEKDNQFYATFDEPLRDKIIRKGWVWTTFSRGDNPDGSVATRQVDLNFQNPKVFLEIVKIMLFYLSKGANWIRLDAIGYLWKKLGTNCLHLPETHIVIEILAESFKHVEPFNTVLVGEVNEPQDRALEYLGIKSNPKSDMIYLFTHFPLAVHAVLTGTAQYYQEWLSSLKKANGRLFVSVLGTHDGMGMKPIGDWLPDSEKLRLQDILLQGHGALANYSRLPGGEKIVYELCSTPWNFINKENTAESFEMQLNRYLAVFALGLMIKGVPSIYINGLLGISNNKNLLDENRTINRQILSEKQIVSELGNRKSKRYQILDRILGLCTIRKRESAFDLDGTFEVLNLNRSAVSILLQSAYNNEKIIALVNVSDSKKEIQVDCQQIGFSEVPLTDLITGKSYNNPPSGKVEITLSPYQTCWLREKIV